MVEAAEPSAPRVRYGRLAAALGSTLVTAVALLGGLGVIDPAAPEARGEPAIAPAGRTTTTGTPPAAAAGERERTGDPATPSSPDQLARTRAAAPEETDQTGETSERADAEVRRFESSLHGRGTAVPARSGQGRRVVFSQSRQRVWLIDADEDVRSTYLVSGSRYDNLDPGTYEVWSRSENAVGIDDSGTMKFFVRFARGDTGAAIGFHDIPVKDGRRVQTFRELGSPRSHGCIRQRRSDARRLWRFAPDGTTVVVTA